MLQDRPTNEQIAANEARIARAIPILLASVVLLVAAIALLMLAAKTNRIPLWLFNGGGTALFLGWLAYMVILTKPALPNIDPFDKDYLRQTIDIQQRRSRISLSLLLINLFWIGSVLTTAIMKGREGPQLSLVAAAFTFLALMAILSLSYGPGFFLPFYRRAVTDELNRAHRARAAQIGYILAAMEMCAILIAAAYHPNWSLVSLPLAIATAIALPGFYFIYLEWRSGRG